MIYKVKNKALNNGEETDIVCDFNSLEFQTQFSEIYEAEHYKNGRRKKDMVVVDLGSNIGLSVLYFKDFAKKIYAIEPNQIYFQYLQENTKSVKDIEYFNIGIGIHNGMASLFSNPGEERTETIFGKGSLSQNFDMQTIETFMLNNKIDHVDLLKIDCEGSEYPIFMSEEFERIAPKIDYIIGESHLMEQLRPEVVKHVLEKLGYTVNFLPFDNMYQEFQVNDNDGKPLTKRYKIFYQTLFEAYR